ncbi:hypothetical protein GUITHDRAFT_111283 [Guillardia theta CCMP2712]|uniref:Uncharacterized protein n=1 Tax=Guillardia theta (strain CCMP2712) TaxID=905079 RepID=L1J386_GUITC|nr:hypothetical protein GUITHDRAFT_111283 [Guillardia theta CCMP2712]EKX42599.1 hypothetical protein GUITHDRAFT_111283 [Guillardia theta CCMP2712]|eukprot:XP_005829579.1 hypothetical protein GUITHDRAFT_111283 [Guillardia theta CCMP2712]
MDQTNSDLISIEKEEEDLKKQVADEQKAFFQHHWEEDENDLLDYSKGKTSDEELDVETFALELHVARSSLVTFDLSDGELDYQLITSDVLGLPKPKFVDWELYLPETGNIEDDNPMCIPEAWPQEMKEVRKKDRRRKEIKRRRGGGERKNKGHQEDMEYVRYKLIKAWDSEEQEFLSFCKGGENLLQASCSRDRQLQLWGLRHVQSVGRSREGAYLALALALRRSSSSSATSWYEQGASVQSVAEELQAKVEQELAAEEREEEGWTAGLELQAMANACGMRLRVMRVGTGGMEQEEKVPEREEAHGEQLDKEDTRGGEGEEVELKKAFRADEGKREDVLVLCMNGKRVWAAVEGSRLEEEGGLKDKECVVGEMIEEGRQESKLMAACMKDLVDNALESSFGLNGCRSMMAILGEEEG